jgi:hypothetical protein
MWHNSGIKSSAQLEEIGMSFFSARTLNMGRIGLTNVREEPKASVLSAYKICDLAYKILKV